MRQITEVVLDYQVAFSVVYCGDYPTEDGPIRENVGLLRFDRLRCYIAEVPLGRGMYNECGGRREGINTRKN